MPIMSFLYDNLEIVVGVAGGISMGGYFLMKNRKPKRASSNLRRFVIKYKKQQDSINKQIKGMVK